MSEFATVEQALDMVRAGKMIVLVDDHDRENEGDLVVAAQHCTAADINFMCRFGRGLVCLALTPDRVEALRLPMMVPTDPGDMGTAFTVSVEARRNVSTGISARDRAETIRVAVDEAYGPDDLVSPGHMFPLRAQRGGVLVRSGHTEGAVDLSRLAGLTPAGVICEIMRDDGEMARLDDLEVFARTHGMPILAIADLIEYRLHRETLVEEVPHGPLASAALGLSEASGWTIRTFRSAVLPSVYYMAMCKGRLDGDGPVLVRAQRASVLGDVFGFGENTGGRLRAAVRQIDRAGRGVFLYVVAPSHDEVEGMFTGGRGRARLGLRAAESGFRQFGLGAQVLKRLGLHRIQVMTNNPRKIIGLGGFGIEVTGTVALAEDA